VLKTLYEQRDQTKQVIYEITGISDIMRSASDPQETYGAQRIKTQWGTQRLQRMQKEVQRYIRDLIRLKAEIIAEKFQPETLEKMTLLKLPHQAEVDAQKQQIMAKYQQAVIAAHMQGQPPPPSPQLPPDPVTWEAVVAALRDDATRTYSIDIETDSTLSATQDSDMSGLKDLLAGITSFVTGIGPAVQAGAIPIEAVKEIIGVVVRRAKMGSAVEDAIDKMQQPAPQQDPAAVKAQADMQAQQAKQQHDQAMLQFKAQVDDQQHQRQLAADMQAEQQRAQLDAQLQAHAQQVQAQQNEHQNTLEAQRAQMQAQLDARLEDQRRASDERMAAVDAQIQVLLAHINNQAKIDVAEITAGATLQAAQMAAARQAEAPN
jgi:hypothetical protein